ncbi:MAG: crossover junction endodeoxyribonuclease RuvC [Clostridia bacterium]|nr:crossover junction endodeoxyribonuclease RuvC [Clostridia bacterium]
MRILGIDPGYAIVGYGILDYDSNRFKTVDYGAVITPAKTPFSNRLEQIFDEICEIIRKHRVDVLSIEKLYFNSNTTTAIDVAQARGVILLAAKKFKVPVFEYTPLQVKQAVTGYGRAEKQQIMELTRILLNLKQVPKPDDTADALAIAICHGHNAGSLMSRIKTGEIR